MKISCQSCQAKYTIADEKVLGKIVKIRCKKCGATIVINGNETAASAPQTEDQPTNVFDYTAQAPSGETWTVNVADGDQRTMTAQEILQEFKAGVVNEETFCWKDGMSDWLPLREIDELYSAATGVGGGAAMMMGGGEPQLSPDHTHQEPPAPSAPPAATDNGFLFGGGGGFGASPASAPPQNGNGLGAALFGGNGPASAPPAATTAARRQGGRGGGGDLFGGVAHAGGEDDVMTSAPAGMPQVSNEPGKLTGQRNENSVLFSLNALTSNAPKEEVAAPQGVEGSGLIDIRALSATMGSEKGGSKTNHVDDIMNLGGGGAFTAALAAPVLAPPSMDTGAIETGGSGGKNQKMVLFGIIGAGGLIALAILLVFALRKPEQPTAALTPATPPPVDTTPMAAPTDTAPPAGTTAGATPPAPVAAAPGTGQAAQASNTPHSSGGGGGGSRPAAHNNDSPSTPPAPAIPAAPSKPSSLADQLRASAGADSTPAAPAAAAGGSAPFDRGAAAAALGAINVAACKKGDGPTGSGHIKVTFAPNGSVQSAVVNQPPFAGTPVGGCVAGKFRGAHIPAFAGSPVPVGKSFTIQ